MKTRLNSLFRVIIAIIMAFSIVGAHNVSYADGSLISEMQSDIKKFEDQGKQTDIDVSEVTKKFSGLGQVLTLVGTGIYVAVIAYMGIKYMTASPDAQAKLKVQLIGVLISGIVLFGAYHIWKMVIDVVEDF